VHRLRVGAVTEPRRNVNPNVGAQAWKCAMERWRRGDAGFRYLLLDAGLRRVGRRRGAGCSTTSYVCLPRLFCQPIETRERNKQGKIHLE